VQREPVRGRVVRQECGVVPTCGCSSVQFGAGNARLSAKFRFQWAVCETGDEYRVTLVFKELQILPARCVQGLPSVLAGPERRARQIV